MQRKILSLHLDGKTIDEDAAVFLHAVVDAAKDMRAHVETKVLADKSIGFYVENWRY